MSPQLSVLSLIRGTAFFLFIFACLGGASVAQNVTLTGEVTDPSNSAVVNAEATLTNNSSHTVRHATTNQTSNPKARTVPRTRAVNTEECGPAAKQRRPGHILG